MLVCFDVLLVCFQVVKGLTVSEGEAVLSPEVALKLLVQELVLVCMGE